MVLVAGCSEKANQCSADSDCKDIAYPFCDVDGQFSASGGEHNVCTIVPSDCPVERCGCKPGASACDGDQHTTCSTDGKSEETETCILGCVAAGDRCATFKASNGLDTAMTAALGMPAAVVSQNISIDTDACAPSIPIDASSQIIAQTSAPGICAFIAGSFDLEGVVATGERALAFVSPGKIVMRGLIDGAARKRFMGSLNDGPGAVLVGACVAQGTGGGGNATNGSVGYNFGTSIPIASPGGLAETNFSPLIGGCPGGVITSGAGGGGGALQIVSMTSIELTATGLLSFGGAGGTAAFGGGSGGTIVFEAPQVSVAGSVAANGGGGSVRDLSCVAEGSDATPDNTPAPGAINCTSASGHGGAGGTGSHTPEDGSFGGSGGGGAVGRILIRTADGTFSGPGTVFSVVATMDTLVKQ